MSFQNAKVIGPCLNPKEYFGMNDKIARGDKNFIVTSSMLRAVLHCPSRWKWGYNPPESDAKTTGSLLDCVLLVPEQFGHRYAIKPRHPDDDTKPMSAATKEYKAWKAEIKADGLEPVSREDVGDAKLAMKRINADEILSAWFDACDRQIWVKAEWKDEATGLVIPCQALLDFVPRADTEFAKCLGDLKCIRSAVHRAFESQITTFGWHIQAAFYMDMFMAAVNPEKNQDGEDRNTWCFCGVENYPPFEPFRRLLIADFVDKGRLKYQFALAKYARHLKTGIWPGYDDGPDAIQGWTPIAPQAWMAYEDLSEKLQDDVSAAEEEAPGHDIPT